MNHVDRFVAPALTGAERSVDVTRYLDLFAQSTKSETPPFFLSSYGASFRLHVNNPVWVIQSLISNAIKEGEGARDLALVADACERVELRSDLALHIGDEARHCRMYVQLVDTVFPSALPETVRSAITSRFPPLAYEERRLPYSYRGAWKMLDYLIQINLGEVRTRIHQQLLEPVLEAYCLDENKEMLCRTLCKLAGDECCHIQYTASRIGALAKEFKSSDVESLFFRRVSEFNQYTERELGRQRDGLFSPSPLIRTR
jgi:hypothetical protein